MSQLRPRVTSPKVQPLRHLEADVPGREVMPSGMRRRAIWCALKFGLLPWWLYEEEKHYAGMGYWAHLWLNLRYGARWLLHREDGGDRAFEMEVNSG
jgi:hypothetical protein